jgi:hypothetical protein
MSGQGEYLEGLAERAGSDLSSRVLWPRTPIGDEIQERIRERVGAGDADVDDPRSRPPRVVAALARLQDAGALPASFTVLDIACGDALVLLAIAARFSAAECHGVDINVGRFSAHAAAASAGVQLWPVPIQELVRELPHEPFDAVLMLNTYRGWESADLREDEQDLPARMDAWLAGAARHLLLTARAEQLDAWRRRGYDVDDLGPGEEDSRLVLMTRP